MKFRSEKMERAIKEILREIGIKKGCYVLDCCCGSVTYAIPAAQLAGERGGVYALSKAWW